MTQPNVPDAGLPTDPRRPDQSADVTATAVDALQNATLSLTARGLYAYITSFGSAGVAVAEIISDGNQPRDEVLAALEELLDADLIDVRGRP